MQTPSTSIDPRRAFNAVRDLLRDPEDLPKVFTVVEALSGGTPDRILRRMRSTPNGAALLRDKPEIAPLLADREALARMPEGSLARAYLAFMEAENISAEGIIAACEVGRAAACDGASDRDYLERRLRDTHDLWHAVTGYRGDVLGEVSILGFIFAQTGNPGIGLLAGAGVFKVARTAASLKLIAEGFARGYRAQWLIDVPWEAWLALPLTEVQARLGVDPLPPYTEVRPADLRARGAAMA